MRVANITSVWIVCAAFAAPAFAADPASEPEAATPAGAAEHTIAGEEPAASTVAPFKYQTGDVVLPNKVATLHLGEKYHYLDVAETNRLLREWGNPPDDETQGAILPAEVDPMAEGGWAVFLTYIDDGHVDDSDAAKIDYDDMLKDMKEGAEDNNSARKDAGYAPLHLVKWAEPPRYDIATKKLYWAKEIDFEGSKVHTLNYDVRVLGREGVLSMEAVASIDQLEMIRGEMRPLLDAAEFNAGHRYAEFNKSTDRLAEYGLGALIATGVAAKLGLFAKLLGFLVIAKKFIIVAVVAIGGFIARLFGKKKDAAT
ncbi:MAG: DUF2167 domain-containing protein [Pseudomonadota bacterium]